MAKWFCDLNDQLVYPLEISHTREAALLFRVQAKAVECRWETPVGPELTVAG